MEKTDRELLELAAKAAGIDAEAHSELGVGSEGLWLKGERTPDNDKYWNPLRSDGDALRLAVKLSMRVYVYVGHGDDYTIAAGDESGKIFVRSAWAREEHGADAAAATRRAIVRCAAGYLG